MSRLLRLVGRARLVGAVLVVVAAMEGSAASDTWARECGGRRLCRCGDQVTQDYELVGDLGPCQRHGLTLGAGVTLNGGGHAIRGSRARSSAGIVLPEKAAGARVTNVEVTGFERGIRLAGVSGARIDDVRSHHNGDPVAHKGYGIDVARGASDNVIENVHVHHNADEGIHIGNGARRNLVKGSRVEENYRENVYFLENEGSRLEGSTLVGGGESSVFVKHARQVRIEGNHIEGRGIQLRGESVEVTLVDNRLEGMGLTIQPYAKGPRGRTVPRDITLTGGRIRSEQSCVRLIEARAVRLERAGLDCNRVLELDGDSDVVALDTPLVRVGCRGPGRAREEVSAHVRFVGEGGEPVAGVELRLAEGEFLGSSGPDGSWSGAVAVARIQCPGPKRTDLGAVTARFGEWSQTLPPGKLAGEVRVRLP